MIGYERPATQLHVYRGEPVLVRTNALKPEAYSEDDAKREIRVTERELNALICKNPEWADKVAIDFGGVPLPSAWMGDIKNKKLLDEFGGQGGFWDSFADGIENIQVREGYLYLKLKE